MSPTLVSHPDDSILIVARENSREISNKLGKELESRNSWMIDNMLSLHMEKTEVMLVSFKYKLKESKFTAT